jgi:hypothetical protein
MNWVKGFAVVTCLAAPLPMIVATQAAAETAATPATSTDTKAAPSDVAKKPAMSKDEMRKAADKCSDEADAKKLTGDSRKAFRRACIRKAGAKRV